MNELTTKLAEVVTQLQNAVKDNAADAVNLGLSAIRVDGIGTLISGIICAILCGIGIFAMNKINVYLKAEGGDWDDHMCLSFLNVAIGIATFTLFIAALCNLLDIWTYVAIIEPKLYLAHHVIASIGAK